MKRIIFFTSILLVLIMGIGAISASDNIDDNITALSNDDADILAAEDADTLASQESDEILSTTPQTITIVADKSNPNQVLNPTVQPAIDEANPGDTIILKGNFVHCHFTINKKLHIIGDGVTIDPCPHHTHDGIDDFGVFYVTEGGSGSIIEGFNFINKDKSKTPFSILVRGASDVTIKDCTMNDSTLNVDKYTGIVIENSKNVVLSNLIVNNTINGISIANSSGVSITDSIITENENDAIIVDENSSNIIIKNNEIIGNELMGIKLFSADYISIINNMIKDNGLDNDDSGSGIYVNTNITKLIVKGNIFLSNNLHAIMYDYRARNLNNDECAENLTIVDNNYFEGHTSMILHHRIYVERDYGTIKYDAEKDVYGDVGEGTYAEGKSYVYMQHAFVVNDILCGFTYYTSKIPWAMEATANGGNYNLSLKLSEIKQVKNGVYQVSIVDSKGNVAADFNRGDIIFFLNNYTKAQPQGGEIYKNITLQNGVATADFRDVFSSFASTGNVITAIFQGWSSDARTNPHASFAVADSDIPIDPTTKLTATKLTTYPLSDSYFSVKLVDSKGNAIKGQKITFKFNGKTYSAKTNSNGIAKVKVSLSTKKTYAVTISYAGSDDYKKSTATSKIVVKAGSKKSKIKASNIKVKKNKKKTFKVKLTTSKGKALKKQKITIKVNSKKYVVKTNNKGIAKISIKLKKVKKYKLSAKFLGNANYKASSKVATIKVTK